MPTQVRFILRAPVLLACLIACATHSPLAGDDSSERQTPLVKAVAAVRPAVVNLRGKKTVRTDIDGGRAESVKQVNGMGTGVVIDESGYILTNYHVVEDVKRIQVTLQDGTTTTGSLLAHDQRTDLALIKIDTISPISTIPLGTSSDVMLAETVAALGNAYGYEDTVTRGIVSELGRTVQVSDHQIYENLIQTDASINPGNSGGPLINLDGEMIGINVAVRVGAQGIAFAIPVNEAIEVAAQFLGQIVDRKVQHGIAGQTIYQQHKPTVQIQSVSSSSPAGAAGLQYGDLLLSINGAKCQRTVDVQRMLLKSSPGETLNLVVDRHGDEKQLSLVLGNAKQLTGHDIVWNRLGMSVAEIEAGQLRGVHPNYTRGLKIDQIRPAGAAEREGMQPGDVLVAMHGWKTETMDNLLYILNQPDLQQGDQCVFYVLRGSEPFYGHIRPDTK